MFESKPAKMQPEEAQPSPQKQVDLATNNNALALLDDLLSDEKNLSKILIIKHNSDPLGKLVDNISKTAHDGAILLERWAKDDTNLDLKHLSLPPGEKATRDAISKSKEKILLHAKDDEFEFQLLLTQVEALNYGAHLAQVASQNERQPEHAKQLSQLSAQLGKLREEVIAMLRNKRK